MAFRKTISLPTKLSSRSDKSDENNSQNTNNNNNNNDMNYNDDVVFDASTYHNEGNRRLKYQNDIKGAIDAFTKAINLSKNTNYMYYNDRANAYLLRYENEKAINDCNASLEICKNVKAYCRKALALGRLSRYDEGKVCLLC